MQATRYSFNLVSNSDNEFLHSPLSKVIPATRSFCIGIAGLVNIVRESYVDHTQFDRKDPHYDPKSEKDKPKWYMVDVKYNRDLKRYIPLHELKELHQEHKSNGGPLANLALFTKARLSVQPLTKEEFDFILELENKSDE